MNYQLICSVCNDYYTPTEEEGKLHEQGNLAMLICGNCCTVKEEPEPIKKTNKIKIKRATEQGLKECEGTLIEDKGFQYCLTFDKSSQSYFFIELSSGGCAISIDAEVYTRKQALKKFNDLIETKSKDEIKQVVDKFVNDSKKLYNLEFPINQPITNN